jgi:hypothetical protein
LFYRRGPGRAGTEFAKNITTPPLTEKRVLFASLRLSVRPTPPYAAIVLVNARETLALASGRRRCSPSAR